MASKLKELASKMQPQHEFEEVFRSELEACYQEAAQANEANDDRQVVVSLSQARVWERLLKLVSGK